MVLIIVLYALKSDDLIKRKSNLMAFKNSTMTLNHPNIVHFNKIKSRKK